MLRAYAQTEGRLSLIADPDQTALREAVWIDLMNPTAREEGAVAAALGLYVPTREDMEEIEISSRLYVEDGAAFMTVTLPSETDADAPILGAVSFVLTGAHLLTVRHSAPRAFDTFPVRAEKVSLGCVAGDAVMLALLDAIVDRLADILERVGRDIDGLSRSVLRAPAGAAPKSADFQRVLRGVGRDGDLIAKVRDSLLTLTRLFGFLTQVQSPALNGKDGRAHVKTLSRDARSLSEHADFLNQQITFLLDATLGLINIEQNAIIKIFSVVAVVFLPPTLIASIYGMNFEVMPELGWPFGYPVALALMVVSAVAPLQYFKRRGWL